MKFIYNTIAEVPFTKIDNIVSLFGKTLDDIKSKTMKKNTISITFNSGETLTFAWMIYG